MIDDLLTRVWHDLGSRFGGPMSFRLLLQPAMAIIFAIRDGMKDARAGKPYYFWSLFSDPAHRGERLQEAWKAVARVFIFAIVMDAIYQYIVLRWFYPGEALIVAFLLAFLPYLFLRGLVNRIARPRYSSTAAPSRPGGTRN